MSGMLTFMLLKFVITFYQHCGFIVVSINKKILFTLFTTCLTVVSMNKMTVDFVGFDVTKEFGGDRLISKYKDQT